MWSKRLFALVALLLVVACLWGLALVRLFGGWPLVTALASSLTSQGPSSSAGTAGEGQGAAIEAVETEESEPGYSENALINLPPSLLLSGFTATHTDRATVAGGAVMSISPAPLDELRAVVELRDAAGRSVATAEQELPARMLYGDHTGFLVRFPRTEAATSAHVRFYRREQMLPHVEVVR